MLRECHIDHTDTEFRLRDTFPRPPLALFRGVIFHFSPGGDFAPCGTRLFCTSRDDGGIVMPPWNARLNTHARTHAERDTTQRSATRHTQLQTQLRTSGKSRRGGRFSADRTQRDTPFDPSRKSDEREIRITAIRSRSMRLCPMGETPCCYDQLDRSASRDWPSLFRRVLQATARMSSELKSI